MLPCPALPRVEPADVGLPRPPFLPPSQSFRGCQSIYTHIKFQPAPIAVIDPSPQAPGVRDGLNSSAEQHPPTPPQALTGVSLLPSKPSPKSSESSSIPAIPPSCPQDKQGAGAMQEQQRREKLA